MFITCEDEHGQANLVVYPNVGERDRAALIGARRLLAERRVQWEDKHAEVPIVHLIARRLLDCSYLLDGLGRVVAPGPALDRALGHADEIRHPEPGSRAPARVPLPPSRDFR